LKLTRQIDLVGQSGAHYRYQTLDDKRFLPPAGANFVLAEVKGRETKIVYVGETDNLAEQVWRGTLERARETFAKAQVLVRLNVTRAVRQAEQADLIEAHQPPLNQ
jgi:hypothetical protein